MQRLAGMGSALAYNMVQTQRLGVLKSQTPMARLFDARSRTQATPSLSSRMNVPKRAHKLAVRAYQSEAAEPSTKRHFVNWTVYKGSNAMCVKPIKPTWRKLEKSNDMEMVKPGVLLLEFAPVNRSGSSSGLSRDYSWDQKQTFALSFLELGSIITTNELNLFHDPNMGTSAKGSVTKGLKMTQMIDGSGGCMLALNVTNRGQSPANHVVPMTAAEMAVLRSIANFLIPKLSGFEEPFMQPSEPEGTHYQAAPAQAPPAQD